MFPAPSHTAKTLALPSSSTLPYATKQLDDTVSNSRTQPLDLTAEYLNPPAKQLDGSTWFKPWQLEPKTPTITAPQQLQRANKLLVDTNELLHPATKQLDARMQPEPLPSSLTEAHHVHAPGKQSQNPENARTRHQSHTTSHLIAHDLSPQTHERDRSLTPHFATRITRCDKSSWF